MLTADVRTRPSDAIVPAFSLSRIPRSSDPECEDPQVSGFRYMLMLADGEPVDPAVFVTAVPNWAEGDEFMVSTGETFRILGINDQIDVEGLEELYRRGIFGIWKVEPA